jgi:uncharacterized linocin/CFP29 family protein
MNRFLRELAPLSSRAWELLEEEVRRALKAMLSARRVVDFTGPLGEEIASVSTGHLDKIAPPANQKVETRVRRVQPLVELRVPFSLVRSELDAIDRGAMDPDFDPALAAARTMAMAEDSIVFLGYPKAGIQGIAEAAHGSSLALSDDYDAYPGAVARAMGRLRDSGVGGPYAILLGDRCYTGLTQTTNAGYPVFEHVRRVLGGPMYRAPAVDGAIVLSQRGGDFELIVGQDLSIGYLSHDAEKVTLYLEESMTFRLLSADAAVPLVYPTAPKVTSA